MNRTFWLPLESSYDIDWLIRGVSRILLVRSAAYGLNMCAWRMISVIVLMVIVMVHVALIWAKSLVQDVKNTPAEI